MKKKAEHIDGIIKTLIEKLSKDERPTSEEIGAAWTEAAGDKAVRHARPVSLRKKRLIINVDGSSWLYELTLRKESLLVKMKQRLGQEKIKELQFRIGEL